MFRFPVAVLVSTCGIAMLLLPCVAVAQDKWFITPNRSAESGRIAAQIKVLFDENAARKSETGENKEDIAVLKAELEVLETEMATIQDHAKEAIGACLGTGKVLQWDGSGWRCMTETDPGIGSHGRIEHVPPFCHPTNGKLIWASTNGGRWECHPDQSGATKSDCPTAPTASLAACGTGPYGHARIVGCTCTTGCGVPPKYQCYDGNWIGVSYNGCRHASNC